MPRIPSRTLPLVAGIILGLAALTIYGQTGAIPTGDVHSMSPNSIRRMTPVADTWIEMPMVDLSGIPTAEPNATPRGSEATLKTSWNHLSLDQRMLLRFVVPTTEPGMKLDQAILELGVLNAGISYYSFPGPGFGTMALHMHNISSPWLEESLTGARTLPTFLRPASREDVPWGPCADGRCGGAAVDVRAAVERWLADPASNHGLSIDARAADPTPSFGANFSVGSRESSLPPELVLRYAPSGIDPTPTPVRDGADLTGRAGFDCSRGGVRLEIMNVGTVGTGAFGVVSSAGPWWGIVDGLGPGETYEIFDPGSLLRSYRIDPYDVVRETDETNNEVPVAIPECVPPSPVPPDPGAGPVLLPWVGKRR